MHDKDSPISSYYLSVTEQDERIIYKIGTAYSRFVIGSLQRSKTPGECMVVSDGEINYAVEEDTHNIYKQANTLADDLAKKLQQPLILHNTDALDTYRGFLDCPEEQPRILVEPSVRRFSKSIMFCGDGIGHPN